MTFLNETEVNAFSPAPLPSKPKTNFHLKDGLARHGLLSPEQLGGRTFPVACVALEITQRCNLDCTLCYLSDLAEAVKDVPLFELERRIDMIHHHYGDHTNIQITGGDPTLRSNADLVKTVEMIKARNMRCALFTNGIKASREMLTELSAAGLNDVVFHVDMTQERKGYVSEDELNKIRLEYIDRAAGLPLRILFNTTVFDGNFREIPALVSFFCDHAETVDFASFQLQAETGRGVMGERNAALITQESVMQQLREGTGLQLSFDHPLIGHPDCNKYTALLISGDARTQLYDDVAFFAKVFEAVSRTGNDWSNSIGLMKSAIYKAMVSPSLLWGGLKFWVRKLWALRDGLLRGKRVHRINFFIHNFMDAKKLERARCETCVFMVATADGPLSMCVHNAKRDHMVTKPVRGADGKMEPAS
ncbi:MAG: radical SAM protein [Pseudomonadota bacterium]